MKEKDKKSTAQNNGVRYEGIDEATGVTRTYYGQIEEIWEPDYSSELQIPSSGASGSSRRRLSWMSMG
jgi:hypothetical protein